MTSEGHGTPLNAAPCASTSTNAFLASTNAPHSSMNTAPAPPAGGSISEEYRGYAAFMAFLTAHYLECKAEYDPLSVFSSSKIDLIPYQIHDFAKLMEEEKRGGCIRTLIAYETGLGKTILVGMLIKELLGRSEFPLKPPRPPARRILIITPPSVLPQFRAEMNDKFGLEFTTFDPKNPSFADLTIASMETLKADRWEERLSSQEWDMIVVDEYHRVSPYNLRRRLVSLLTKKTRHFIALTATPHDGSSEKYNFRLSTIAPSPLVIRRTKKEGKDINNRPLFDQLVEERKEEPPVTPDEEDFYRSAEQYIRRIYRAGRGYGLLGVIVSRAISSSMRAGLKLLKRRREKIVLDQIEGITDEEAEEYAERVREGGELTEDELEKLLGMAASREELEAEIAELKPLIEKGERLLRQMPVDSKGKRLLEIARGLNGEGRKAIIFTSFRETVEYLKEILADLNPLVITGSMDIDERKKVVDEFTSSAAHRVIVGTDAMGESLNLQAASVEVNYEVPWSPVAYIQRVGRIWRLKQQHKHLLIVNFLPPFPVERRVMEVMLEKIARISREFGDVGLSVFGKELGPVEEVVKEAYTGGDAEGRLEKAHEATEKLGKEVLEVLSKSMSLPRVVNAESLQKLNIVNLNDIVLEADLLRFLQYLKDAGAAVGDFPSSYHVHLGDEYVRVDSKSLSLESKGMRAAIQAGKGLLSGAGYPRVSFSYSKDMDGEIVIKEVRIGGRAVFREPLVETPDGVLTYRGVLSLAPAFTGRIEPVRFLPAKEYEEAQKGRWLEYARRLWDEGLQRIRNELSKEKDEYRREGIRASLKEWFANEPNQSNVEVVTVRLGAGVCLGQGAGAGTSTGASANATIAAEAETGTVVETGAVAVADPGQDAGAGMGEGPSASPVRFVKSPEDAWRERHEVEMMAMRAAETHFRAKGYRVKDVSAENRGYDLECSRADGTLRVEVKGLRHWSCPELTPNEKVMAEFYHESYVLFIAKEGGGAVTIYAVPDPLKNLNVKEVLRPFYELTGFERFVAE
ncbi:MAG: helicase-related protein [Candidatus Methanosuratincola verstraetei]|jgi:superfamily II DNA or RNA helicase